MPSESHTNTEILTALCLTCQDGRVENRDKNYFVRGQNIGEKIFLCLICLCNIKSTRRDIRKETVPDYFKLEKMNANSYTGRKRLSFGLSSTSDVITFDQNWHHLYSTSAGGNDLSIDTQIRVIGLMQPEICTKMLKKLSEKLRVKFPAPIRGYPVVKNARLDDAFLEVF